MESNILKMIADHEKTLYDEDHGICKQLERIRIASTDFVSKKAVLGTIISLVFVAVMIGTYMFGLDKRIVRIEEQFKALNEKQKEQVNISEQMLTVLQTIYKDMNKKDKKGG